MSKDITIITGFFDCGRGEHELQARSNDIYFSYFEEWARIRNRMIVYVAPQDEKRVRDIRNGFGLADKTEIVTVENIWNIEPNILARMQEINERGEFKNWRSRPDDISNDPKYSYITFMRFWFFKDSFKRGLIDGQVAWVDFGWNHGGAVFEDKNDFDFDWQYEFSDKINLFSLADLDKYPGIIQLQNMEDTIMAGLFVLPAEKSERLYSMIIEAINTLLSLDCYDDDQMYLRLAVKRHPEEFDVHISSWFLPMKEYGGNHIKVKQQEIVQVQTKREALIKRAVRRISIAFRVLIKGYDNAKK